ncbi:MAG TPA: ATP-binding protein [Allosphingosinicella sp.]|jgi:signal transduction histidine kinase/CheY-like chemotaxis protein
MRRWRRVDRLYIDLPVARPGSFNAYLIAIVVPGIATLLRIAIDPWVTGVQFITYFPLLILVALVCGYRAALLSAFVAAAAAWYFIVEPRNSFALHRNEDALAILLFLLTALMIVSIAGATRVAIGRYRMLSSSLGRRVAQRTEELKSAQASLVQAQKMEAVGQLTGGIAHDFNNMLAIIVGNLDIAKRRLGQGRSDVERQIDNAMDGAQRAAALTRRLLVFARRQPLEPAVTDVNTLLGELADLLARTIGEKVRIAATHGEGLWRTCVDRAQLESALINLAINARDAMPKGGTLWIETQNASIGSESDSAAAGELAAGDYVAITVADTGTGMSPEVAARAIEPFFTTKEVGRGTGLGLSQVYGFVRQSGGHVSIESEEGEGTVVRLYLPRHEGGQVTDRAAPGEAAPPPRGSPGEVILVAEDEEQVRSTTVAALTELGYGVREARTGIDALAILASDPAVTLLFTDVVMPGLDGRQLAERALRQRPDLKILYTTGYAPEGEHETLADDHPAMLRKPFSYEALARKVRGMIDD